MPNHVFCRLNVYSDNGLPESMDELKEFKKKAKSKKQSFDLDELFPMPKELRKFKSPTSIVSQKEYDKEVAEFRRLKKKDKMYEGTGLPLTTVMASRLRIKYGVDNWYDWANKNWGTKWGTYDSELVNDDEYLLEYEFSSAWVPPINGLTKVSKDYPNLNFILKYEEEGEGYIGKATFKNGEVNDKSIE